MNEETNIYRWISVSFILFLEIKIQEKCANNGLLGDASWNHVMRVVRQASLYFITCGFLISCVLLPQIPESTILVKENSGRNSVSRVSDAKLREDLVDSTFVWNDYRISDGIEYYPGSPGCESFPDSIVCEYRRKTTAKTNVTVLREVLQLQNWSLHEAPEVAAHLRLGDGLCAYGELSVGCEKAADVLAPDCWMNLEHCWRGNLPNIYAYPKESYLRIAAQLPEASHIFVISEKRHWTRTVDPRNGTFVADDKYIDDFKVLFEGLGHTVHLREPETPDMDFAFACSAKVFLQGGGGFSRLIASVVQASGRRVITTTPPRSTRR
jgi:hypothetical protein